MQVLDLIRLFTLPDAIAVGYTIIGSYVLQRVIENPRLRRPSVAQIMALYRADWMREFVTRQPRLYDANVLDGLRQGITFYASSCLLGVGAGMALLADTSPLQGLASSFDLHPDPVLLMKAKILFVLIFLINAFLKFVWSHRLFAYCSVLMASVPNNPLHPQAYARAERAAAVNITAARNYNRGLGSVYYALGALGWLLGPWVLLVTMTVTFTTQIRREFASQSRAAIVARLHEDDEPPPAADQHATGMASAPALADPTLAQPGDQRQ